MEKINYQKELEKIISQFSQNQDGNKPSLLLHACCGPCSSYVIEYLSGIFDITIYYYNPNIHPENEYFRRLEELKKFLTVFPDALKNKVKLVVDDYNPEDFFAATNVRNEVELQKERERGERCRRCYRLRMRRWKARKQCLNFHSVLAMGTMYRCMKGLIILLVLEQVEQSHHIAVATAGFYA